MDKRFWISGIVMFIASMMTDFAIHAVLLDPDYKPMAGTLYRTEADSQNYMHYMLVAHVLIGFALTWLYRKGAEAGKPALGQGLRFGLAVTLLATIPGYLIYYAVQPLPAALVHKQMIFSTIAMLFLGVLVAFLNPRRAN